MYPMKKNIWRLFERLGMSNGTTSKALVSPASASATGRTSLQDPVAVVGYSLLSAAVVITAFFILKRFLRHTNVT